MLFSINLELPVGAAALSLVLSPRQEAVSSFASECLTEPIKSGLFYRRELIELATSPSLGSSSMLKITRLLFISWRCSCLTHLSPLLLSSISPTATM